MAIRLYTYRPFTSHNNAALPVTPRLAKSKVSESDNGQLRLENQTHFIWPIPSLTENNTQALDRVLSQETRELSEMNFQLGCLCPSYFPSIITIEMISTADASIPATSQAHGLRNSRADHNFPSLCLEGLAHLGSPLGTVVRLGMCLCGVVGDWVNLSVLVLALVGEVTCFFGSDIGAFLKSGLFQRNSLPACRT